MESKKEPVLLLTYFYPPCNLTASQRIYAWAKYLGEYGYYPIVITRNWDRPISKPADVLIDSGTEIRVEKHDGYEVHFVPYHASMRDRIYNKYQGTPLAWLSKLFTAAELFSLGFTNVFTSHYNIYQHAYQYARKHNVKKALASGNPFDMFKFGYLLHKNLGIKWIADYRDPWNTQLEEIRQNNKYEKFNLFQIQLEKKWVGSAGYISTVSQSILEGIQKLVPVKGRVIMNGFLDEEYAMPQPEQIRSDRTTFRILHVGTLPNEVEIELVLKGFKSIIDKYKERCNIIIDFVGVNYIPVVGELIRKESIGYEENIFTSDRISRKEVFEKQQDCNMLLMCGHRFKGYPSSKIFEYVGLGKPVILVPSDTDIMEEILSSTEQAIICQTADEITDKLSSVLERYISTGMTGISFNAAERKKYTRRFQTKELALMLDTL